MSNFRTGAKGIELIKRFESLHDGDLSQIGLQPKPDPVGIWTEGWGHAMVYNGKFLRGEENKEIAYSISKIKTIEDAERILKIDIMAVENMLNAKRLNINQNQFDALVSLIFNIGYGAFQSSTLLRRIMAKTGSIESAFMMWNKAKVKGVLTELRGLTLRRAEEAKLYLS